jgi:hypothetical protein
VFYHFWRNYNIFSSQYQTNQVKEHLNWRDLIYFLGFHVLQKQGHSCIEDDIKHPFVCNPVRLVVIAPQIVRILRGHVVPQDEFDLISRGQIQGWSRGFLQVEIPLGYAPLVSQAINLREHVSPTSAHQGNDALVASAQDAHQEYHFEQLVGQTVYVAWWSHARWV